MVKTKEETDFEEDYSPEEQMADFMKNNPEGHYNDEPSYNYLVPSGSLTLDIHMNGGLKPGIARLVGISEGGKAQPLWSKILTPQGWKKMGELKEGDFVIGSDGKAKKITKVFPQGKKEYFKISFNDETSTHCCGEHLWTTETFLERRNKKSATVKSLFQIQNSIIYSGHSNHAIRYVEPIAYKSQKLPIHPYVLGVLLGDGCITKSVSLTVNDSFIVEKVNKFLEQNYFFKKVNSKDENKNAYGLTHSNINKQPNNDGGKTKFRHLYKQKLNNLELMGCNSFTKFIPEIYLHSNIQDRIHLLHGLMDTDGSPKRNHHCVAQISTTSEKLALDMIELCRGLGAKVSVKNRITFFTYKNLKRKGAKSWLLNVSFSNKIIPFSLPRKLSKFKFKTHKLKKYITDIQLVGETECQCIVIDSKDHLYVTDDYILTHNSSCSLSFIKNFLPMFEKSRAVIIPSEAKRAENLMENRGDLPFVLDGSKWENHGCFVYRTGIYEKALKLIRELVENNPTNTRYIFLIDSVDALIPQDDFFKLTGTDANKVASGPLLASDFLKKTSLMISSRGHVLLLISQVRAEIQLNKYIKIEDKITNAKGGNALIHYADWILKFEGHHTQKERIWEGEPNKSKIIGHFCDILFEKTPIEKTGLKVKYPIKYTQKGGAVWKAYEVADNLLMWGLAKNAGAWVTLNNQTLEDLKENGFDIPAKHNGIDKFRTFFDENPKVTEFLIKKLKSTLM